MEQGHDLWNRGTIYGIGVSDVGIEGFGNSAYAKARVAENIARDILDAVETDLDELYAESEEISKRITDTNVEFAKAHDAWREASRVADREHKALWCANASHSHDIEGCACGEPSTDAATKESE